MISSKVTGGRAVPPASIAAPFAGAGRHGASRPEPDASLTLLMPAPADDRHPAGTRGTVSRPRLVGEYPGRVGPFGPVERGHVVQTAEVKLGRPSAVVVDPCPYPGVRRARWPVIQRGGCWGRQPSRHLTLLPWTMKPYGLKAAIPTRSGRRSLTPRGYQAENVSERFVRRGG